MAFSHTATSTCPIRLTRTRTTIVPSKSERARGWEWAVLFCTPCICHLSCFCSRSTAFSPGQLSTPFQATRYSEEGIACAASMRLTCTHTSRTIEPNSMCGCVSCVHRPFSLTSWHELVIFTCSAKLSINVTGMAWHQLNVKLGLPTTALSMSACSGRVAASSSTG